MHGGAVLAVPVHALRAEVQMADEVGGASLALVRAAFARVGETRHAEWGSEIPRSVGLAGSSALVIAALRASGRAPADPFELAELALSIERDDLGIPGGLQDRAVQAFDAPVFVDAAVGAVTPFRPGGPLTFVVAWDPSAAADSGDYHRALSPDPAGMDALARVARAAADAFVDGDVDALEEAMDASARIRERVAPLSASHNALTDHVRAFGLCPNSTGSGGAVIALLRGDAPRLAFPHVVCSFEP